jgi:pyrimidine-nucleoside phosphorylase
MIHLGGKAESAQAGRRLAEAALEDGSALAIFFKMIEAQGGDIGVFSNPAAFHKPGAAHILEAWKTGYIVEMDTTRIGWAVQRTGAGRENPGAPGDRSSSLGWQAGALVDPHAGILFHARRGAHVQQGQPIATLYATSQAMLHEPIALLKAAILISGTPPQPVDLVSRIFTRENAEAFLQNAVR